MRITKQDIASRTRRNKAASAITDAMEKVSKETGGLSATEWAVVLNDALTRMLYHALRDELMEEST